MNSLDQPILLRLLPHGEALTLPSAAGTAVLKARVRNGAPTVPTLKDSSTGGTTRRNATAVLKARARNGAICISLFL